jgi:uncharacterized membrane protein
MVKAVVRILIAVLVLLIVVCIWASIEAEVSTSGNGMAFKAAEFGALYLSIVVAVALVCVWVFLKRGSKNAQSLRLLDDTDVSEKQR